MLNQLNVLEILRALQGPMLATEMFKHDSIQSKKVWEALKVACEGDQVIYALTGSETSVNDKLTGMILLVENCLEF